MEKIQTLELEQEALKARGSIAIQSVDSLLGEQATATITILDFNGLIGNKAENDIEITDYEELAGVTLTVNGVDLVEGVDFDAETSNAVTATNLANAIDGVDLVEGIASDEIVKIRALSEGTEGNAITFSTNATAGISLPLVQRLEGGSDPVIIKLQDYLMLTEGVDFDAEVDNETTASNLASVIDDDANFTATADGNVVTIVANVGSEFNVPVVISNIANPDQFIQATDLTGGVDVATITIGEVTFTAGVDFDVDDIETANSELKTAIETATEFVDVLSVDVTEDDTLDIVADETGSEYNFSISTNSENILVEGLSGGNEFFFSEPVDFLDVKNPSAFASLKVLDSSRDSELDPVEVNAQMQDSFNGFDWYDLGSIATLDDEETIYREITNQTAKRYVRLKMTCSGGEATVGITLAPAFFFNVGGSSLTTLDKNGNSVTYASYFDEVFFFGDFQFGNPAYLVTGEVDLEANTQTFVIQGVDKDNGFQFEETLSDVTDPNDPVQIDKLQVGHSRQDKESERKYESATEVAGGFTVVDRLNADVVNAGNILYKYQTGGFNDGLSEAIYQEKEVSVADPTLGSESGRIIQKVMSNGDMANVYQCLPDSTFGLYATVLTPDLTPVGSYLKVESAPTSNVFHVAIAGGSVVPSDDEEGFTRGCQFTKSDGTIWYNIGDSTSCLFKEVQFKNLEYDAITLIQNLPEVTAETLELIFDTDTQIDTILDGGLKSVTLIVPSGIRITNRAGNISNNYELWLDGNSNIDTSGTTVLNLKLIGNKWIQTSPIVVLD